MLYAKTDRSGLLKLLGALAGKRCMSLVSFVISPRNRPQGMRFFSFGRTSPEVPESLPDLIVTGDIELRSFLAWTSTYVEGYIPFTALTCVIDSETFQRQNGRHAAEFLES